MANDVAFGRMMDAGFDLWRLGWQVGETWIASQAVIATRMAMIGEGMRHPARMPLAEMARFVPEKVAAFGAAGSGAARSLRPVTASGDAGMAMLDLLEQSLAASLAWWAPLHRRSTANARRLGRRRR